MAIFDRNAPRRLLRGEVEDYQPLRPDRLRPFTREAIEAEKREKWVTREFPDEIRERTSMADLRVRSRRPTSVPSLQYDSCPSHDAVGGFFFDLRPLGPTAMLRAGYRGRAGRTAATRAMGVTGTGTSTTTIVRVAHGCEKWLYW